MTALGIFAYEVSTETLQIFTVSTKTLETFMVWYGKLYPSNRPSTGFTETYATHRTAPMIR